ncbi:heterokaryon incompatibility protein-domain-containing protein [Phyllosticta capitalensis]|uniref:heterokaryon incompatibility protein-domain-containing protein n=1 Tax=Phyllosticta capitalensis TaxID=121624 RepID=UPI00312EFFBB
MSSQYEYSSLATPSTIRLIQVKKQKVNGVIDCAIRHVDYAKQPDFKYYALSYVWGDSSPTRQLYLTDPAGEKLILPIHENLWRFLNWAWNRGWHDHWIWTDRICLNQQDKEEMAQQIPRMGKAFANAEKVLSWLGMSEQEGLGLQARLEGATSQPVAPVLLNEYWSRVWIVQEVLNAKDVVVVVGNVEARLWDLKHRFHVLLNAECGILSLFNMRNQGLLGLLKAMSSDRYQCQRPHDRVELYKSMSERVDLPDDDDGDASVDESSIDESSVDYESPDDEYCVCKFAFCPSSVDESPIYEPSIYEDPSVNKSPPVDKPPAHNSSAAFNRLALKSSMKPNILRRIKERMRPRTKHADRRECRTQALDDEVLAEGSRDFVID